MSPTNLSIMSNSLQDNNNSFNANNKYVPPFSILQWDIRSLRPSIGDLSFLISDQCCSVAILPETWLLPCNIISIPQFHIFRADRLDGYGGVAIVTHQAIQVRPIDIGDDLKIVLSDNLIDLVGVELFSNSANPIEIWSIYISPSSSPSEQVISEIFSLMSSRSILAGDFNAHHFSWRSANCDFRGNLINSISASFDTCVLNTGSVTRVNRPPFNDSAIDISFSSSSLFWYLSWRTLDVCYGSDHYPIIIDFITSNSLNHRKPFVFDNPISFNIHKADWSKFYSYLDTSFNSFTFSESNILSYENFVALIISAAKASIPLKRRSGRKFRPSPIWWNSDCTNAIKNRTSAFKVFKTTRLISDFLEYRRLCASTRQVLKKAKRESWRKVCSNFNPSVNLSDFWNITNRFKNCIQRSNHHYNEDWFTSFCDKITPPYVPSLDETGDCTLLNFWGL